MGLNQQLVKSSQEQQGSGPSDQLQQMLDRELGNMEQLQIQAQQQMRYFESRCMDLAKSNAAKDKTIRELTKKLETLESKVKQNDLEKKKLEGDLFKKTTECQKWKEVAASNPYHNDFNGNGSPSEARRQQLNAAAGVSHNLNPFVEGNLNGEAGGGGGGVDGNEASSGSGGGKGTLVRSKRANTSQHALSRPSTMHQVSTWRVPIGVSIAFIDHLLENVLELSYKNNPDQYKDVRTEELVFGMSTSDASDTQQQLRQQSGLSRMEPHIPASQLPYSEEAKQRPTLKRSIVEITEEARGGEQGRTCSLVEWCMQNQTTQSAAGKHFFGRATHYVCHCWTDNFVDLIDVIRHHHKKSQAEAGARAAGGEGSSAAVTSGSEAFYYIDFLVLDVITPPWEQFHNLGPDTVVQLAMDVIQEVVVVMSAKKMPSVLTNLWNIFEMMLALESSIRICPNIIPSFQDFNSSEDLQKVFEVFCKLECKPQLLEGVGNKMVLSVEDGRLQKVFETMGWSQQKLESSLSLLFMNWLLAHGRSKVEAMEAVGDLIGNAGGSGAETTADMNVVLSRLARTLHRLDEAKSFVSKALEVHRGTMSLSEADVYSELAEIQFSEKAYESAGESGRKALRLRETALGTHDLEVVQSLRLLVKIQAALGEVEDVTRYLQRMLDTEIRIYGYRHLQLGDTHAEIGDSYRVRHYGAAALKHYRLALKIFERYSSLANDIPAWRPVKLNNAESTGDLQGKAQGPSSETSLKDSAAEHTPPTAAPHAGGNSTIATRTSSQENLERLIAPEDSYIEDTLGRHERVSVGPEVAGTLLEDLEKEGEEEEDNETIGSLQHDADLTMDFSSPVIRTRRESDVSVVSEMEMRLELAPESPLNNSGDAFVSRASLEHHHHRGAATKKLPGQTGMSKVTYDEVVEEFVPEEEKEEKTGVKVSELLEEEEEEEEEKTTFEGQFGEVDNKCVTTLEKMASIVEGEGRYKDAVAIRHFTVVRMKKIFGSKHDRTISALNDLAVLLFRLGHLDDAEPLFTAVLFHREAEYGEEAGRGLAEAINNVAVLFKAQHRMVEAMHLYKRGLEMQERLTGDNSPELAVLMHNLATLYRDAGHLSSYSEALGLFEKCLEIRESHFSRSSLLVAQTLNNMAGLLDAMGMREQAVEALKESIQIKEKLLGTSHPSVATSLMNFAMVIIKGQASFEKQNRARLILERVLEIRRDKFGHTHPQTLYVEDLAMALQFQDSPDNDPISPTSPQHEPMPILGESTDDDNYVDDPEAYSSA